MKAIDWPYHHLEIRSSLMQPCQTARIMALIHAPRWVLRWPRQALVLEGTRFSFLQPPTTLLGTAFGSPQKLEGIVGPESCGSTDVSQVRAIHTGFPATASSAASRRGTEGQKGQPCNTVSSVRRDLLQPHKLSLGQSTKSQWKPLKPAQQTRRAPAASHAQTGTGVHLNFSGSSLYSFSFPVEFFNGWHTEKLWYVTCPPYTHTKATCAPRHTLKSSYFSALKPPLCPPPLLKDQPSPSHHTGEELVFLQASSCLLGMLHLSSVSTAPLLLF